MLGKGAHSLVEDKLCSRIEIEEKLVVLRETLKGLDEASSFFENLPRRRMSNYGLKLSTTIGSLLCTENNQTSIKETSDIQGSISFMIQAQKTTQSD